MMRHDVSKRESPHVPVDASVTAKPRLTCSSIGEGQQSESEETVVRRFASLRAAIVQEVADGTVKPDHGDHRQPERQGRAKRGALLDPQGFDAGKKITGRKRHILVDTLGLLLSVAVHPANIQDCDGWRWCSTAARVV